VAKDPKWKDAFIGGVVNGDLTAVQRALDLGMKLERYSFAANTQTPLLYAAAHWDRTGPDVIALLLAAGADVNAPTRGSIYDGETAIMEAARSGWVVLVRQLLKAGADPNRVSSSGDTALVLVSHCAAPSRKGRMSSRTARDPEGVVRELLNASAKPNAWALQVAALFGRLGVARLLLAAGVKPNGTGPAGTAPLQTAVDENQPELVALLLEAGADPSRPYPRDHADYPGMTPLEVARKLRLKKVIPLLEAACGSVESGTAPKRSRKASRGSRPRPGR
jgi:ankyrin repeat protein